MNLLVSLLLTLCTATAGSKSVLTAIDIAFEVKGPASSLGSRWWGLGVTLLSMLCATFGMAVLLGMPAAIRLMGLSWDGAALIPSHRAGDADLFPLRGDHPALSVWFVAPAVAVSVDQAGSVTGDDTAVDRIRGAVLPGLAYQRFWRDLWSAGCGGWDHAVVLFVGICDSAWGGF
ncbi:MAG TPA: hypothetical protein VFG62_11490 [Rhodopila sp.]|nr:hypothetical protein [Rhodopila sp.]